MSNHNFRSRLITEKEIANISLHDALAFYKDRITDASDFTFFFVGNITMETIRPLINTYIGSLPSTNRKELFSDLNMNPASGKISSTVYRGLEDKANVTLVYHGAYSYTDETNVELDALEVILQNKLTDRLREKESGVYSPSVSLRQDKIPAPYYKLQINFNCATENVEKLIAAVQDEVNQLKSKGASEEDVEKFHIEQTRQFELNLRDNGFWLAHLKATYKGERGKDWLTQYPVLLQTLTTEGVKQAASTYLKGDNFIRIVLLPENAKQ